MEKTQELLRRPKAREPDVEIPVLLLESPRPAAGEEPTEATLEERANSPAAAAVSHLASLLERTERPTVPFARPLPRNAEGGQARDVPETDERPVRWLVARIVNELAGRKRLYRFPRYSLVSSLLDPSITAHDQDSKKLTEALRGRLAGQRIVDRTAVLGMATATGGKLFGLVALLLPSLVWKLLFLWRLRTGSARWGGPYHWLRTRTYQRSLVNTDFFNQAYDVIGLVHSGEPLDQQAADRLLVYAFLADLRHAHRRGLVPWRGWPRTTQCVAVLDEVSTETGGRTLCELVNETRNESGLRDPLLIVGHGTEFITQAYRAGNETTLAEHYNRWRGQLPRPGDRSRNRETEWLLARTVTAEDKDHGTRRSDTFRNGFDCRRRPLLSRPLVLVIVLLALVPGPLAGNYLWRSQTHCHPGWLANRDGVVRIDGECIGLAAQGARFVQPEPTVLVGQGASAHKVTLADVQQLIYAENARVAGLDRPYVTAIYLNPLTQANDSIVRELMGVYLAQRHHNKEGQPDPLLRVRLANGGAGMNHALEAARQIVAAAERDPSIVGVIGVGRNRPGALRTVRLLSAAGLPVVATTNSGQRLHGSSPFYFHIAPTNGQEARVAVDYVRTLDIEHGAIIVDTDDPYGRELGALFQRGIAGTGLQERMLRLEYPGERARNVLPARVREACQRSGGELDLIYYAGRSEDLTSLFAGLNGTACSTQGHEIKIMSGDDLSRFTGPLPRLFELRYTTLTYPPIWRCLSNLPPSDLSPMYAEYERVFEGGYGSGVDDPTLADGHTALGYDATWAIAQAAKAARARRVIAGGKQAKDIAAPGPAAVWHELGRLHFNGATGWIDLREQWRGGTLAERGAPWPRAVTLVRVNADGSRTVEVAGEPLLPDRDAELFPSGKAPKGCPSSTTAGLVP